MFPTQSLHNIRKNGKIILDISGKFLIIPGEDSSVKPKHSGRGKI